VGVINAPGERRSRLWIERRPLASQAGRGQASQSDGVPPALSLSQPRRRRRATASRPLHLRRSARPSAGAVYCTDEFRPATLGARPARRPQLRRPRLQRHRRSLGHPPGPEPPSSTWTPGRASRAHARRPLATTPSPFPVDPRGPTAGQDLNLYRRDPTGDRPCKAHVRSHVTKELRPNPL
jgi:hypothetical protein